MNQSHLTDKEEEIMLLLWEHGPCSVKELTEHFAEPRPHVNTVSTFVRALEKKGYVGHEQGRYGGFNYFAIKSKADYRRNTVGSIVRRYFGNAFSLVSNLVEDEQINADELRSLLELVESRKEPKP